MSIHTYPPQGGGGGGGGTITGGSNVGGGKQVFKQVSGTNLVFRTMIDSPTIAWTQNANDLVANFVGDTDDVPEGATNLYFSGKTTDDLPEGATNLYLTYPNLTTVLALPTNSFLFSNPTSDVVGYGNWAIDPVTLASNVFTVQQPNNLGQFPFAHSWYVNVDPLQASPNDGVQCSSFVLNLDSANSGFDLGTNGDAGQLLTGGYSAQGSGNPTYGRLRVLNFYSGIGNGTDPFTVKGWSASSLGFNGNANVTLDGSFSGYDVNVNVNAASIPTSNFSWTAYSDFSQIPVDLYGYQGLVLQPNISKIKNNHNFNGVFVNPTITNMEGNAGFYGVFIGGQITNQGASNGWQGAQINPNIVHLTQNSTGSFIGGQTTDGTAEWQGQFITTQQINTTGAVKALVISTADGHQAIDATGHCNMNVGFDVLSSLTQQYGHVIGGEVRIPNGTSVTGTDVLANNMAFTVNTGDATSDWTQASPVGLTTLGFVGQIIGDGDILGTINFCLNGYNPVVNGTVNAVHNFSALSIPNSGTGAILESVMYYADQPFGGTATGGNNWGVLVDVGNPDIENYMPRLAVGLASSSQKVTNDSCGIELISDSQAMRTSSMTTADKNALTALNGMWTYDETTERHQFYENGAWVGLGGGPTPIAPSAISAISTNTAAVSGTIYLVDTSGGAVTVTLPAPSVGGIVVIKDTGDAQTNNIDVAPNGGEDIDGTNANYVIDANFESDTFVSDGTNWFVL